MRDRNAATRSTQSRLLRCAHKIYWDFAFELRSSVAPTGRQAVTYITYSTPETESSRRPFQAYQKCPICARVCFVCAHGERHADRVRDRKRASSKKQSKIDGGPHALTSIPSPSSSHSAGTEIFLCNSNYTRKPSAFRCRMYMRE